MSTHHCPNSLSLGLPSLAFFDPQISYNFSEPVGFKFSSHCYLLQSDRVCLSLLDLWDSSSLSPVTIAHHCLSSLSLSLPSLAFVDPPSPFSEPIGFTFYHCYLLQPDWVPLSLLDLWDSSSLSPVPI
ncbi:hypothetical protein GE061_011309 [Apolygus lucorum]|uniref:Uncharacterized protein n=1 Tax=Apolygus lucorum TaxID=248454 RepID=A0A8S9XZ79_APOLU|nr:hypothetical protein GE061_011309 [Apolygus lucorum]